MAPERLEALPLLSTMLDIPIPANEFTRTLEPQSRKSALEALLLDGLSAATREAARDESGLLVVLENLHWIDPASRDLLEQVVYAIADLPVLVVLAFRPPTEPVGAAQSPTARFEHLPYFTLLRLTN